MRLIPLPVLLLLAPLAEIVSFGLVVEWIGFWRALALVAFTSLIGLLIVRHQGFGLIAKVSAMARQGQAPAKGVGSDLMIMVGGLLLLLPGFLTDFIGLLLLIPFVRNRISMAPSVKTRVYTTGTYTETYEFRDPVRPRDETVVDLDHEDYRRTGDNADNKGQRKISDR